MKNYLTFIAAGCSMAWIVLLSGCSGEDAEPNKAPQITVSGDVIGITGQSVALTANASDPDGDALQVSWNIVESPAGSSASLTNTSNSGADFSTAMAGFYRVEVVAEDGRGGQVSDVIRLYIGGLLPTSIGSNTVYPDLFDDASIPDYYAKSTLTATAGLTFEPGVVVECDQDVFIWINGNAAFIKAEGTASKNIILRGIQKTKGSWRGLGITSANLNNKLNYVQMLHTGSSDIGGRRTAIRVQSNVSAVLGIENTTISQSAGHALFVDGNGGVLSSFAGNNFSNNDFAPIRLAAENLYALDGTSVYTNNGEQAIEVAAAGNTNARFTTSGTVRAQSIPILFLSSAEVQNHLTLEAGTTVLFNGGLRLWITTEGAFTAVGTADKPITLSATTELPGVWRGIEIHSPSPLNRIDYGIVSYGGNTSGRGANIYMFGSTPGSQLTLTNSTISDSQTYGVRTAAGNALLTESDNNFQNNASGDIRQD